MFVVMLSGYSDAEGYPCRAVTRNTRHEKFAWSTTSETRRDPTASHELANTVCELTPFFYKQVTAKYTFKAELCVIVCDGKWVDTLRVSLGAWRYRLRLPSAFFST